MEINVKQLKDNDIQLNTEISTFEFSIILNNNKIFNSEKILKDLFFVIRNIKDGKKRRPVYKSHEYDFKLNELMKIPFIKIESDLLCNNNEMPIYFELYSQLIKTNKCLGICSFTLNKLKTNEEEDEIEQLEIKSQDKNIGIIGILQINYKTKRKIDIEEFIRKEGQIHLEIAIDYTKSNINDKKILYILLRKMKKLIMKKLLNLVEK